jgi:hypothetical protein
VSTAVETVGPVRDQVPPGPRSRFALALVGGGAFASGMRTGLIAAVALLAATAAIGLTRSRRH